VGCFSTSSLWADLTAGVRHHKLVPTPLNFSCHPQIVPSTKTKPISLSSTTKLTANCLERNATHFVARRFCGTETDQSVGVSSGELLLPTLVFLIRFVERYGSAAILRTLDHRSHFVGMRIFGRWAFSSQITHQFGKAIFELPQHFEDFTPSGVSMGQVGEWEAYIS
jgi:hypothetical protein